jgi:transposase
MASRPTKEIELAIQRTYSKFTAQQKLEITLAGLRGERSVKDVCREHEIAETLYYSWRDKLLEGGRERLSGTDERQGEKEMAKRIRELERALGTSSGG